MHFLAMHRTKLFWLAALLLCAGVLGYCLVAIPTQVKSQKELVAITHPAKGLTFVASLPANRVAPGTPQPLHIELLSEAPVSMPASLNVCVDLPQQQRTCKDWPVDKGKFAPLMDFELSPTASVLSQFLTVNITASGWPTDLKAPARFQRSILRVGPFQVEKFSAGTDKRLRALARLRGLLKDITLPVLISFLGIYYARKTSEREEEGEVRRLLLTKVQGLTKSFYTHLVYQARNSIRFLEKGAGIEGTYHLLSLLLVNSQLKEQEGGVFFSSQAAEQVYREAIYLILDEVRIQLNGEKDFRAALDEMRKMTVNTTNVAPRLADFLAKPPTAVQIVPNPFLITALDLLKASTLYELDAPLYEHWYKERGQLEFETKAADLNFPTKADLAAMTPEKQRAWRSLIEQARLWLKDKPGAESYLKELPRY